MQEELVVCTCVGSFINWANRFEEVSGKDFDLSVVLMSLDQHKEDLALKTPVITDKNGLRSFLSLKRFLKLDKNKSNSLTSGLGER